MKHTKGPWHVRDGMERAPQRIFDSSGELVAEAHSLREAVAARLIEAQANARLIAQAPTMYEALDYIATEGSDCPPNMEPAIFYRNQLFACIGRAARAIAKAEDK